VLGGGLLGLEAARGLLSHELQVTVVEVAQQLMPQQLDAARAIEVARELERRTEGKKVLPLTIHWSGCSAGCGLHQVSTIGLQGCRSRVNGQVVDAAHVCVKGSTRWPRT
jgi:uncharacterized protein YoaH (UPF0181 family)